MRGAWDDSGGLPGGERVGGIKIFPTGIKIFPTFYEVVFSYIAM